MYALLNSANVAMRNDRPPQFRVYHNVTVHPLLTLSLPLSPLNHLPLTYITE